FLADPTSGELRIGTPAGISEGIVLSVINRLSRQYPRIVFHVAIAAGSTLLDQLRERDIEIGFDRLSKLVGEEDIDVQVLYEEPLVVVCGRRQSMGPPRKIKLPELLNEPWTWPPPRTPYDIHVVDAFRTCGHEPPRAAVYTHAINLRISLAA